MACKQRAGTFPVSLTSTPMITRTIIERSCAVRKMGIAVPIIIIEFNLHLYADVSLVVLPFLAALLARR